MKSRFANVLITGASSGIGLEMARWWAARGATVHAAARRLDRLEKLAAEFPDRIVPVVLDVADIPATIARIRALDAACGGLDCVVANAGRGDATPADLVGWSEVEAVLQVNVMGAAATLVAAAECMKPRGRGHLVGVSSLAGHIGFGANSAYSGSKAFLSTFLASMHNDFRGSGIGVTTVEPGFVKSEMTAHLTLTPFIAETADAADAYCRAIEAGRRMVRYPFIHAIGVGFASLIPHPIWGPLNSYLSRSYRKLN